jgi:hypothetical protein
MNELQPKKPRGNPNIYLYAKKKKLANIPANPPALNVRIISDTPSQLNFHTPVIHKEKTSIPFSKLFRTLTLLIITVLLLLGQRNK